MSSPVFGDVRSFPTGGTLRFVVKDSLDHPLFFWPRTLLSYPVRFDGANVKSDQLSLVWLETGQKVPMQLSEVKQDGGRLTFAVVNFFSDLPTAGERVFELSAGGQGGKREKGNASTTLPIPFTSHVQEVSSERSEGSATTQSVRDAQAKTLARFSDSQPATSPAGQWPGVQGPGQQGPPVCETVEAGSIVLDSGAVKVRIPASQKAADHVPGPILQMNRGGGWLGSSSVVSPKRKALGIETACVESGPLFITYRISYTFDGNARYVATVRVVSGQDYVECFEDMAGFARDEQAQVEWAWTGFHPTHRQAPNHPYQQANRETGAGRYNWEKIDDPLMSTQHGVSPAMTAEGELPFRLGAYQPWGAYVMLTYANFWDDRCGDAVGVFIDKAAKWQDHEYAIWASSNTLQVRYFYKDGLLTWRWPLVTGTRSTAVACYDHKKDTDFLDQLETLYKGLKGPDGALYRIGMYSGSYTQYLQNRHGTFDLNMVKDWVLEYPDAARRPEAIFTEGVCKTPAELEGEMRRSNLVCDAPWQGTRQNAGLCPVCCRDIYGRYVDSYNRLYPQMTGPQKKRITALLLMLGYVCGEEDFMPIRSMLSGHPNFLSDTKTPTGLMAFLFPDHPMAKEWADEFERFMDLNTRYHTRPPVEAWDARGGRWTENLGTYVWAALRPASRSVYVLENHFDGRNRFANPQTARIGDWLVNALTAPFAGEDANFYRGADGKLPAHYWGIVTPENGPRRLHPPQGAHSARRLPPRVMWWLGSQLMQYDPLTGEHMMWASRPTDDDAEHMKDAADPWHVMMPPAGVDNLGTNPHLASSKYTGYGIMLRAAVDTPREISIHLQQIDAGPNYRWGGVAEGGCGGIYYYAAGKAYSHNGVEDVGDRACQDTDFCCNFGVWKDGRFKAVGRNVLDRPLYDLGGAQYAELLPQRGAKAYSWPEYQARRTMLVGSDYLVTYDAVFSDSIAHRFSWFVHVNENLPFIHVVKGAGYREDPARTEVQAGLTKGVWYDGMGDFMAVVTHEPNLLVEKTPYGCTVKSAATADRVFFAEKEMNYTDKEVQFKGNSGVIRRPVGGGTEMAIFHGSAIACSGLSLAVSHNALGVSVQFQTASELAGVSYGLQGGELTLQWKAAGASGAFYLDGNKSPAAADANGMTVTLPAGRHRWQVTAGLPIPAAPTILRTENGSGGAKVFFSPAGGAAKYRIELSKDNGATWSASGETAETSFLLSGLANGTKVHVRAVGVNESHEGEPSAEYPIYVTEKAPLAPDGLRCVLGKGKVDLTWGQVLGASEYRLYRRAKGTEKYEMIYHGPARTFGDERPDVIPAFATPGASANELTVAPPHKVYEYAVSAVNGNGEGSTCRQIDTDPSSWLNWDPMPGEGYRRRLTYNVTPFVPDDDTPLYYPK